MKPDVDSSGFFLLKKNESMKLVNLKPSFLIAHKYDVNVGKAGIGGTSYKLWFIPQRSDGMRKL